MEILTDEFLIDDEDINPNGSKRMYDEFAATIEEVKDSTPIPRVKQTIHHKGSVHIDNQDSFPDKEYPHIILQDFQGQYGDRPDNGSNTFIRTQIDEDLLVHDVTLLKRGLYRSLIINRNLPPNEKPVLVKIRRKILRNETLHNGTNKKKDNNKKDSSGIGKGKRKTIK